MGSLTPIGAVEVNRGDTFKHNTNMFMRLSPLVNPIMHPVHAHIHHIFVPLRLIWDKWEDFITGGEDFDDASVVPTIDTTGSPVAAGDLLNHLGVPVGFEGKVNAFTARAYAFIYNEIYRDDQLQDKVGLATDSGDDTTTNTDLLNCNWAKDPFVSARPDEQLGAEVNLPLGGEAPVTGIGVANQTPAGPLSPIYEADSTSSTTYAEGWSAHGTNQVLIEADGDDNPNIYADLSKATASTINELRLAIATQQWQEKINTSGNKYQDYLKRYGIKYSDARIDRPEWLAGGKQTVQFSEIIQTAEGTDPVGTLKGHGIAALRSNNYMKFFEEDGIVISLLNVKPISMYMQSLPRMYSRRAKEDFYQKEYEILGMQEVPNKEVKHDHSSPDGTFGYQPRFDDYRRVPNTVHGEFATVLKDWHMAREFAGDIALNDSFVTCTPTKRIFADQTSDHLYLTVQHKLAARRLIRTKHQPSGLSLKI
jgi:hypothetical protein